MKKSQQNAIKLSSTKNILVDDEVSCLPETLDKEIREIHASKTLHLINLPQQQVNAF
jgi:hypothetical protein